MPTAQQGVVLRFHLPYCCARLVLLQMALTLPPRFLRHDNHCAPLRHSCAHASLIQKRQQRAPLLLHLHLMLHCHGYPHQLRGG